MCLLVTGLHTKELGRCDCPPNRGGPDCSNKTLAACELVPGYVQKCASDGRFVPTCECAIACDNAGWALMTDACLRRVSELDQPDTIG